MYLYRDDRIKQEKVFLGRSLKYREDIIGHSDSEKMLWDGCVITKLSGTILQSDMNKDILFDLQKPDPDIASYYTKSAAISEGLKNINILLLIGTCVLLLIKISQYFSIKRMMMLNFIVLPFLTAVVFGITYHRLGKKVDVKTTYRGYHYQNHSDLKLCIADMFSEPSAVNMSDEDILK